MQRIASGTGGQATGQAKGKGKAKGKGREQASD